MGEAYRLLGFTVANLDERTARRHGLRLGSALAVDQVRPGSQAERIGLRPGDLIRQLGDSKVANLKQFQSAVARNRLLTHFTVMVQRGRVRQYVTLER
jgi:S1-C subfamily serine protease